MVAAASLAAEAAAWWNCDFGGCSSALGSALPAQWQQQRSGGSGSSAMAGSLAMVVAACPKPYAGVQERCWVAVWWRQPAWRQRRQLGGSVTLEAAAALWEVQRQRSGSSSSSGSTAAAAAALRWQTAWQRRWQLVLSHMLVFKNTAGSVCEGRSRL